MKKWYLKAIVQKGISFLPYNQYVNFFFQKYVTKGVVLTEVYFQDRLIHAQQHIKAYQKHIGSLTGTHTLELGTGWFPIIPISLFLSGASTIYTVDISPLCHKKHLQETIRFFLNAYQSGQLHSYFTPEPLRINALKKLYININSLGFSTIFQQLHIHYLVTDATHLSMLPNNSIDLIHSNNTFEHIYPTILTNLLNEFKRLVKKGGLQSHFIDLSDHFAHFDPSITIYNFLKYSERQWAFIDNNIQPQNRLRFKDYKVLYQQLGVPITNVAVRKGNIDQIRALTLATPYQNYTPEELAISHGYIFSVM